MKRPSSLPVLVQVAALAALAVVMSQAVAFGVVVLAPEGPQRVPDSDLEFTFAVPRSLYAPPDWHPGDHPPMPPIVANDRK